MMYHKKTKATFLMVTILSITFLLLVSSQTTYAKKAGYEVWILDQSDTSAQGGGKLYIFKGSNFKIKGYKGTPEVIDFAQTANGVGDGVGKRPHMIFFNNEQTHAIISSVSTGHVYIMNADTREILASIRMGKEGDEMRGSHAAIPAPDGSMIISTNHKKLERITSDYINNKYDYNPDDALNLQAVEDETHPDNWIVCPVFTADSRFVVATVRGGGLYVIDVKSTPMKIVASFDSAQVGPNGCGGLLNDDATKMYINSGGGTPKHPLGSDLYIVDLAGLSGENPTVPEPSKIFSRDGFVDSHGMTFSKGKHLWVTDRAANLIEVVDTTDNKIVNQIDLTKGRADFDPAPDLIFSSPRKNLAFAALRGPSPLTANAPDVNNAVGNSPGLGVIKIHKDGMSGRMLYVIPISNIVDGKEIADAHGIAVRELR